MYRIYLFTGYPLSEVQMIRAVVFHLLLFSALRTGWFLPDMALFHSIVLMCIVQHSFLRISIGRLGGSRATSAVRLTFEVYRRLYEVWHAGCGAALALAQRSEPIRECVQHYYAEKARALTALTPGGESRALFYLQGSYLSAQLMKDCMQFHELDPEQTANMLTKGAAVVKGLSLMVRASAIPRKLAEQEAEDANIIKFLQETQSSDSSPQSSPRSLLHAQDMKGNEACDRTILHTLQATRQESSA